MGCWLTCLCHDDAFQKTVLQYRIRQTQYLSESSNPNFGLQVMGLLLMCREYLVQQVNLWTILACRLRKVGQT